MSIINKGDFVITNVNNKTTLSYRSPSVTRINFEKEYASAKLEEEKIDHKQKKANKGNQKGRKRRRNR